MKTRITAALLVLLVAAIVIGIAVTSKLAVYISIVAVGMALALQKYVASFFGYFVISFSKMLQVGDRIRIDKFKGDVRNIGLFHLVLDEVGEDEKLGGELTGRILHVPNLIVLDQPVLNYSKGFSKSSEHSDRAMQCEFVFDEIRIPVSNSSNIARAARVLEDIISSEDEPYMREARTAFQGDYPTFLQEAESNRHVLVHVEAGRVWIKGKFVTPFRVRNDLRSRLYLKFIEHTGKDSDINLA
jgi:small-conductance mechanosensitive channel